MMDNPSKARIVEAVKVAVLAEIGKPEYWPIYDHQVNEMLHSARAAGFRQEAVDAAFDAAFNELDHAIAEGALKAGRHVMVCRAQARQRQMPFAPARLKRW